MLLVVGASGLMYVCRLGWDYGSKAPSLLRLPLTTLEPYLKSCCWQKSTIRGVDWWNTREGIAASCSVLRDEAIVSHADLFSATSTMMIVG